MWLSNDWTLVFIDAKTAITNANPMPLVHSVLYCRCTSRCIYKEKQTAKSKYLLNNAPLKFWPLDLYQNGACRRDIFYFVNHLKLERVIEYVPTCPCHDSCHLETEHHLMWGMNNFCIFLPFQPSSSCVVFSGPTETVCKKEQSLFVFPHKLACMQHISNHVYLVEKNKYY